MGLYYDYSATNGTRYTHYLYSRTGGEEDRHHTARQESAHQDCCA